MTVQTFEKGARYKAEITFEVNQDMPEFGRVQTSRGNLLVRDNLKKVEKVPEPDRFERGHLYMDTLSGKIFRRTGYDEPFGPKWAVAGGSYVRTPDVVDESRLERVYLKSEVAPLPPQFGTRRAIVRQLLQWLNDDTDARYIRDAYREITDDPDAEVHQETINAVIEDVHKLVAAA